MVTQQSMQFNCYKILRIPPTASPEEIRKAWVRASKKHHPDVGGSDDAQKRVNLAYEVLANPIDRYTHDIFWRVSARPQSKRPASQRPSASKPPPRPRPSAQQAHRAQRDNQNEVPLSQIRERVQREIGIKKEAIWHELEQRSASLHLRYQEQFYSRRKSGLFSALSTGALLLFVGSYPILWIGVLFFAFSTFSVLGGISIDGKSFSIFDSGVTAKIKSYSKAKARESCARDVQNLDKYSESVALISELLLRSSTFDDSEEQVARRLAASFFLMGYQPYSYDRETRLLIFSAGTQRIAVRFRHRTGIATNISYVKKLVRLMHIHQADQGYLFCTPGLSGNGAMYAVERNVKWYSLETMNDWIEKVLQSDYAGPTGDILGSLDRLRKFISSIAKPIPRRARSYRYRSY